MKSIVPRRGTSLLATAALIACLISGLLQPTPALATPSVLVETATVRQKTLSETLPVYGSVITDPERVTGITAAHAGQITRVWVGAGQVLHPGQRLLELVTDPAARRDYEQAKARLAYAEKNLTQVRDLFSKQLATRADLAKAEQALANARSSLAAEIRRGVNLPSQVIRADSSAVVTKVAVATGDRVQPGSLLLTLGSLKHVWVTLGIEPEDAIHVHAGMPVDISPVFGPATHIRSHIAQVHALINPQTRLVDAVVKLSGARIGPLIPGTHVLGRIRLAEHSGLAVPAQSVLQDRQGAYVFIVKDGAAHRVDVKVDFSTSGQALVSGPIKAGEQVVRLGNYELHDRMAVRGSEGHP